MAKLKTLQEVTDAALKLTLEEQASLCSTLRTSVKSQAEAKKEEGDKAAKVLETLENGNQ